MILSHIAALAKNSIIGSGGDLPWDVPEDMKFFREKTQGHIILMGRKTFESFPKPLKNRLHVVVTQQSNYSVPEGVQVFSDISKALDYCQQQTHHWPQEVFVIGGGEIYRQTLKQADRLYLTHLEKEVAGDTKYPPFENEFTLFKKENWPHASTPLSFCIYVRKNHL